MNGSNSSVVVRLSPVAMWTDVAAVSFGEAVHVQWMQGLFEEVHVVGLELAGGGDGVRDGPIRIEVGGTSEIDAQANVRPQRLASRGELGHPLIVEVVAPAKLDGLEALLAQRGALAGDLLRRLVPQLPLALRLVALLARGVGHRGRGAIGQHPVSASAAQQLVHRLAGGLTSDVPHRHVDGPHRIRLETAAIGAPALGRPSLSHSPPQRLRDRWGPRPLPAAANRHWDRR